MAGEAKNVASGTTRLLIPEGGIHSELGVEAEEDFNVSNHNQTKLLSDWAAQSGNRYVQSSNQFSTTLPQYSVGKVRASPGEFEPDAPSRPSETFCDKLGVSYQRPVGAQCNFGLSDLFHRTPLPKCPTKYDIFGQGSRVNKQRAGRLDTKTSNLVCTIKSGHRLRQHNFCDPQKRWGAKTSVQPEAFKSVCQVRPFQNGGHTYAERPPKAKRFFSKNRSKGCVFYGANMEESPKVSSVYLARHPMGVSVSTVWLSQRTTRLYKKS